MALSRATRGWCAAGSMIALAALVGGLCAPAPAQPVFAGKRAFVGAPGGPGDGPPANDKSGVHLPQGRTVSFTYTLTDGAGYRWDIQYYGTVGQGTNYAYSGGLYLQIDGSSIHSNGRGWMNADGDEIEIGPYNRGSTKIYRRIRVYKDQGLARWMDIFENSSAQDVSFTARIYTNTNWQVGNTTYSVGKGSFTDQDCAFVTETQGGNAPAVMHYVCTPRSKVRPQISLQNNQIYVTYNVTVPANKTAILCYFESQHQSAAELVKLMKNLRPRKALADLSPAVRKMLVNMPIAAGVEGVELERVEWSDIVVNRHGDPIHGTISNESFPLETLFGRMDLPAGQVIGMTAVSGEDSRFRVLLSGGQILAGQIPGDVKLQVAMPSGGTLQVPMGDVQQCSYRISASRPEESPFAGPLIILRTGDRVAVEPGSLRLQFRTGHGVVDLRPQDLTSISLDNLGNAVHRAAFLNGSHLAGFLEPESIPLTLKLGPKLTVPRNLVCQVAFAAEEKPDPTLDAATLSNGDELLGRLADRQIEFRTDYGTVSFRPENIQSMTFSPTHLGRVAVQLWDETVLRGQVAAETLEFEIVPGPTVRVSVGQCTQLQRNQAIPPEAVRAKVEKLVAQLGAESYKDRQTATEALLKMGKGIAPMLRKYLETTDPEIRQRIEDVLEKLGGVTPSPPAPPQPMMFGKVAA